MRQPSNSSALEQLMALCQEGAPWRICLWDWSGITRSHGDLALDFDRYQVHRSPFCEYAKSTAAGLRRCLRCRQAASHKALKQVGPVLGTCHMGLNEWVLPIRLGEQVLGILFGGQIHVAGSAGLDKGRAKRKAAAVGISAARLASLGLRVPVIDKAGAGDLRQRMELIVKFIVNQLRGEPAQNLSGKMVRRPVPQEIPSMRGKLREAWVAKSGVEIARLDYHKPLSSTRIAARLGVSLSVFCRCFKEQTGRSFKDYVQDLRIAAASRLLIESESSIAYIASETGFQEPNFFSRVFRARTGLSPSQFREKHWKIKASKLSN
jgi:AraC-like DNA-binding protein